MNEYKIFWKGDLRQVYRRFFADSDEEAIKRFKSLNVDYLVIYRIENGKKKYKLDFVHTLKY